MNNETTSVNTTPEIKRLWNSFDRLIAHKMQQKQIAEIKLMAAQHRYYCSQIKDKNHVGNPYYKGIEIKRMGK